MEANNEASVVRESAQTDDAKITFSSSFGRCVHAGFDYSFFLADLCNGESS